MTYFRMYYFMCVYMYVTPVKSSHVFLQYNVMIYPYNVEQVFPLYFVFITTVIKLKYSLMHHFDYLVEEC